MGGGEASKSRRLTANACRAACIRMADQRERREASTALRKMFGNALLFVWAKTRRKVVASGLHRPSVSMAQPTSMHRLERRSSGYVRSLNLRASWSAAPAYCPAPLRARWMKSNEIPMRCRPRVALPPTTIGYDLGPSVVVPVDVVQAEIAEAGVGGDPNPASRQTLAAALSKRTSRPLKNPGQGACCAMGAEWV